MSGRSAETSGRRVEVASSLPVLMKAVWLVMKKRDVHNYGRILEFLEFTHEQVPGLLCYMHHAKLSTGLRGKIVLHMIEEKKPLLDILTELNCHFPQVFADDAAAAQRNVFKVRQCKIHFRKLVLRMIRDERFRKNYVQNTLHLEYGEKYMAVLEKLLWEFLYRLQTVLNQQVPQTTEPPVVDEDYLSCTPAHPSRALHFSDIPGVNNTEQISTAKKKRANPTTHNVTSSDRPEERPSHVRARSEERQSHTKNEQDYGSCEGTRGLVREPVGRRTPDSIISPNGGNGVDEPQPPYFTIFGFDGSQSCEVDRCEKISPPDPLQSQSLDLDPDYASDPYSRRRDVTGHGSFSDLQVVDVAETSNPSQVINDEAKSVRDVSGDNYEAKEDLMVGSSRRRVQLAKIPLTFIKHLDQPQVADSGSSFCSDPTDNDSNDPDYVPGSSYFRQIREQINKSPPKRVLRLSSRPRT